jgi:predicted transcriptional regulator
MLVSALFPFFLRYFYLSYWIGRGQSEDESFGRRLARLRKERGFTQVEIAERVGIIQALVSDYELDKLRLNAEMVVRFAGALEITN